MKIKSIEQLYRHYEFLNTMKNKKKSWNFEATSYAINLRRVTSLAAMMLVTELTTNGSSMSNQDMILLERMVNTKE